VEQLTFACGLYDRMLALYTGEVKPAGIDLEFRAMDNPREVFDRMAKGLEFDAAEMSSSEFISRMSARQCPFVAIPVFPSRVFRHSFIFVNARSGICTPKDLEGKRVGVALYTMTAAIWIRGHLQHDYGVDLSTIRCVQGAINSPGAHGAPTVLPMVRPPKIEVNASGKSLSRLLEEGTIDAIAGAQLPESLGRNPEVQRLFPEFRRVEREYYERTRIFPIMHLVAIKRSTYEKNPSIAASLYRAFCESKDRALAHMRYLGTLRYMLPWLPADLDEIDEVFGGDCWPYGIEPNRPTLEALIDYMVEQSIIAAPLKVEDLFVPIEV
jgi:4,5-dihydroxyphthalate decarboxylase